MATLLERASHSVNRMFLFVLCLFATLVISYLGFEGMPLVLVAPVPVVAYLFYFSFE